ncbi:acyl-CoA carboxylase subunit epsilon [Streptomyces sp. R-74717]|uniref:acyl-CoA carboxylase epsilon subunit n=1 Tax=Streptomyces TaxID=1883 RepID=UPI00224CDA5E|nr:acyl-CoA carboxylase epsilon subunit [Streptomyces atratus]MCX5341288.1 acyl-CoA carboxylase epsilon subunit [Streptomyces atratus]
MIKVVRGNPTPEELAAALAVVRARAAATASDASSGAPTLPGQWSDPGRIARRERRLPGPRAWARTYWPG